MSLTLVISGKNVPYIGNQWEECPLHWRSVGRMSLTLVISGKNVLLHWWSVGRMFLTLVVSGKNVPYIGGQWEECSLHWRQWEECSLHWWSVGRMSLTL
ncbi:unnamed protein product, partial [Staurois parvus]